VVGLYGADEAIPDTRCQPFVNGRVVANLRKPLSERSKPDSTWEGPYEGVPTWMSQALGDWAPAVIKGLLP
jgi:hypothetical protein